MQGKNFISAVYFSKSRKLDIRETASPPSVAVKVLSLYPLSKLVKLSYKNLLHFTTKISSIKQKGDKYVKCSYTFAERTY